MPHKTQNYLIVNCSDIEQYYSFIIGKKEFVFNQSFKDDSVPIVYKFHSRYYPNYFNSYLNSLKQHVKYDYLIRIKSESTGETKVLKPSFLLGEQGIGQNKREKIIKQLINSTQTQKVIACLNDVSESTVSRIKNKYANIKTGKLISKIQESEIDYPLSPYLRNPASNIEKLEINVKLIGLFKEIQERRSDRIKTIHYLSYWELVKKGIKLFYLRL